MARELRKYGINGNTGVRGILKFGYPSWPHLEPLRRKSRCARTNPTRLWTGPLRAKIAGPSGLGAQGGCISNHD